MATQEEVRASIQAATEHEQALGHLLRDNGYYALPTCNGYRIPFGYFDGYDDDVLNVYVLPWSRGWSIFVSPDLNQGVYNWRDVPPTLKPFQRPLYAPKYLTGPQHVSPDTILAALHDIWHLLGDYVRPLAKRRAAQHTRDIAIADRAFRRKLNERTANTNNPSV